MLAALRTALVTILLFAGGCSISDSRSSVPLDWQPIDSINRRLPRGIRVYAGNNRILPLRAWYVRIVEHDPAILTRVAMSDDTDGRETVESFAADSGVCVVVNGGYFVTDVIPAVHAGLLLVDDRLVAPATRRVERQSRTYETARAALGFTLDDRVEIAWATSRGDSVFSIDTVPANAPGRPADWSAAEIAARPWHVRDAVAAGPMLVQNGAIDITTNQEVFFDSSIPAVHPRTAAGVTRNGDLLLLVVDGRQVESRGVSLEELAVIMHDLGAVRALNLDGGGSSTLVVNGVLLNRPTGDTRQREVMSALVTYCNPRR